MAKKTIVIGGFNKTQRENELEKTKAKYQKKGYKFLEYIDNGTLKSIAVFEVDNAILRKERSRQLIVIGVGFLIISAILFSKSTNIQEENSNNKVNEQTLDSQNISKK
ncbi:MAG: hypothetical protein ACERKK_10510 [Poseidonibacter sp.]|uniref:hypothetical protein n=1 Tax=Poseidonibacter sp. TaxID=2321188 RepID=UPI00359D08E7